MPQFSAPELLSPRNGNQLTKLPPANSTTSRMANRNPGIA